ncbi:GNAT family N-acetyltransferase [Pseudalkalibacillus sp. Hm43]|uniref:GNAT family N-acetyltransferase n=1 Tax=Pseudalkalibacillus sp. Hm43 TaxID=3450742 RepID=UPI003F435789
MIRKATIDDVTQIAEVHVSSWKTTYKGIVSDSFLAQLSVERKIEQWTQVIQQTGGFMYVAEENGRIVGFVNGGRRRIEEIPYDGEIYAIYLLSECQGKGFGKRLFEASVDWMKSEGLNSMYVWVLEENSSKFFYEKMGGRAFKEDQLEIEGVKHTEIAYGWEF